MAKIIIFVQYFYLSYYRCLSLLRSWPSNIACQVAQTVERLVFLSCFFYDQEEPWKFARVRVASSAILLTDISGPVCYSQFRPSTKKVCFSDVMHCQIAFWAKNDGENRCYFHVIFISYISEIQLNLQKVHTVKSAVSLKLTQG